MHALSTFESSGIRNAIKTIDSFKTAKLILLITPFMPVMKALDALNYIQGLELISANYGGVQ